jgi:hypothetical protein
VAYDLIERRFEVHAPVIVANSKEWLVRVPRAHRIV